MTEEVGVDLFTAKKGEDVSITVVLIIHRQPACDTIQSDKMSSLSKQPNLQMDLFWRGELGRSPTTIGTVIESILCYCIATFWR